MEKMDNENMGLPENAQRFRFHRRWRIDGSCQRDTQIR